MYLFWIYVICLFCLNPVGTLVSYGVETQILQGESQFEESRGPDTLSLYKVTGMKITCTASWFLLSGTASLQAVEEMELDGKVLNNVPYDIQDGVSTLIDFLNKANTDKMVVGKILKANMNAGMEIDEVVVKVTDVEKTQDGVIYTFTSQKLPDVLKYPTILSVQLLDDGKKKLPISGVCTIEIPILRKIRIKGTLNVTGIKNCES